MNKLRRALSRVGRASIWAPGAIPPDEIKYAGPLKRVALPAFDLLLILGGIYAVRSGIPALDTLLPDAASNALGIIFVVCAVVCLFGAAFPRLWPVEMAGKIMLVSILGMYFVALRTVGGGTSTRLFVSAAVIWGLVLPVLRLWYLGVEYAGRHNKPRRRETKGTK